MRITSDFHFSLCDLSFFQAAAKTRIFFNFCELVNSIFYGKFNIYQQCSVILKMVDLISQKILDYLNYLLLIVFHHDVSR